MQTDPVTGDCFTYNLELGRQSTYRIFKVFTSTGDIEILATIKGVSLADAIDFGPNAKNRWIVVDRHHGKGLVGVSESDPSFAFHPVNGWDQSSATERGTIVTDVTLDISPYENLDVLKRF
ncbi:MAG: hypothetical protein LQ346_002992 [Caloplaca aetnensis]|nr:MAG: hypothetical protein LQ346_002992 [Caloplaca aetnensis]